MNALETIIVSTENTFKKNVEAVHRLIEFDRVVLDSCITQISNLADRLEARGFAKTHPTLGADKTLQSLKNIRQNDSLRPHYAEMFNQSLVLLVSYFGLSIRDLFKGCFTCVLQSGKLGKLGKFDVKVSLADLQIGIDDFPGKLADIFVAQKEISFQDMQSIGRAFDEYLGFKPEKDKSVNNLILAQACRHVIVHSGSKADAKLLKQIADAKPRDLKENLTAGQKIQFEPAEIRLVGESMVIYMRGLGDGLKKQWGNS